MELTEEKLASIEKLIKQNYYNYSKISEIFDITTDQAISIFKKLNLKVCNQKENCQNSNGPVLIRSKFQKNSSTRDGLRAKCKDCIKRKKDEYNFHRNKFYSLNSHEEKINYIKEIINNYQYNYKEIASILKCNIDKSIKIFKKLNLKTCSRKNCISPYGKVQPRENFENDRYSNDKLRDTCLYCVKKYKKENSEFYRQLNRNQYYKFRNYWIKYHQQRDQMPLYYGNFYYKLEPVEETRKDENNYLQVKCTTCQRWFTPTKKQVDDRLAALNGKFYKYNKFATENRFYCSEECKDSCSVFRRRNDSYRILDISSSKREVQQELRELVLERDNYECQKCGTDENLICHHKEGVQWEPLESADIDKCITLCYDCHNEIHKIPGCTREDLKCK